MTIHLPDDLARYIQNEVQRGNFVSAEAAIAEAVRLLRQRLQNTATLSKPSTEEEFQQRLIKKGLLSSIPESAAAPGPDFEPIAIEGEPLSETIINDRR
jgi:Arc/MetJ-type ribon-helix-helix transcriptional regulator